MDHLLTQRIFKEIHASLAEQGLFMREDIIVDASIVAAPFTKNKTKQRDPEMRAHIGVDAVTGLTHRAVATSANVADVTMAGHLVRVGDKRIYGDSGSLGMEKYLGKDKRDPDTRGITHARAVK